MVQVYQEILDRLRYTRRYRIGSGIPWDTRISSGIQGDTKIYGSGIPEETRNGSGIPRDIG